MPTECWINGLRLDVNFFFFLFEAQPSNRQEPIRKKHNTMPQEIFYYNVKKKVNSYKSEKNIITTQTNYLKATAERNKKQSSVINKIPKSKKKVHNDK